MQTLTTIQQVAIWILPILLAVTLHEAAHGFVAYKLGDDTAYRQGRITVNPLKHIDPVGTIIIPLILVMTTSFVFGWAKPVPVIPERLRNPKRDFALVALAGPFSNFLMALAWMGILKFATLFGDGPILTALRLMCVAGVTINIVLMILNLIPIPPLDGSRFLSYLLPSPWDTWYNKTSPLGILIILLLIMTGVLSYVMLPAVRTVQDFLLFLFQIH